MPGTDQEWIDMKNGWFERRGKIRTMESTQPDYTVEKEYKCPEREEQPVTTGVLDFFPDAIREIAKLSKAGNDKHHPGGSLRWTKGKSDDHADALVRHLLERNTTDIEDGFSHTVKVAWRALALLQIKLEETNGKSS